MTDSKLNLNNLSPEEKKQLLAKLLRDKSKKPKLFPTSFAQQRLWFLQQLEPESTAYNIPAALELTGKIDLDILEASIQEICDRHEVLRTVFVTVGNQPQQKILKQIKVNLPVVDLSIYSVEEQESRTDQVIKAETKQAFNLEQEILWRSQILNLGSDRYILLFTLHHIITDYYSMRVLIKELAIIYQAKINHAAVTLPKLELQYVDFAVWQRKWLESDNLKQQLSYWQQQLADAPSLINLPTDFPRPQRQTFRGNTKTFTLSRELSQGLQELSNQENTTLYMTLLAGLQTLLYRYTEQADILVGSTVANRDKQEISNLIGLFVNNLIFRTRFTPQLTFKQLLQQVKETALSAYENQDLPYEYLVEKLQPERNLSHNPLFQVMFVLHNTKSDKVELPSLSINYLPIDNQTSRFDLSLDMYESESGLIGSFEYNSDLFTPETIERLISHFEKLLIEVTTNSQQIVTKIDILTLAETELLINNFNAVDYPQDYLVHELFQAKAQENKISGEKLALVTDDKSFTYIELNQRVNQLAHYLKSLGVSHQALVGILLNRDSALIIALLAVLKIGAAYIPLDPAYPKERINYIIDDADIAFLITKDEVNFQIAAKNNLSIINLNQAQENIQQQDTVNLNIAIHPHDLAYVIYTSGSTGNPKGVAVQHASLLNFLYSMEEQPGITAADKLLAVTTISFDIAALEIFLPLINGVTVILASKDTVIDADLLSRSIVENDVNMMQATPATWRMLLDNNWQGKPDLKILSGGEALPENLAAKLASCCQELWNLYGPTETTIWSAVYKYTPNSPSNSDVVSIGKAIANTQFYILDSHLNLVPEGLPGELYIGGAGLARGYLNRGDLTAERFIPFSLNIKHLSVNISYFASSPRIYKTGDRVRQLPNGNLEYLGRLDNQVKIRGFRIELGEIEAILNRHPNIKASVAVVNGDRLIAYIIVSETEGNFRQFLADKLPSYMIPAYIIQLESFPLTPNGKIDRKALPLPDAVEDEKDNKSLIAPQTATEEVLLGIWQEVLNRRQISINSNFFDLGGHSLLVTRVISQVRKALAIELPLRSLFEHPTISDLGQVIDSGQEYSISIPLNGTKKPFDIPIVYREGKLPLSFAQQRQWFLHQLEPNNLAYNIATAVKITGSLEIPRLQECLNLLVKRQEILQTAFLTLEGKPQLEINPDTVINLEVFDLQELSEASRQLRIEHLQAEEARQPFTLEQSPLMRVKLLQIDREVNILLLSIHHIIADGWSLGVLVRDLVKLYQGIEKAKEAKLPPSIQYVDYAAWQKEYLQGEVLNSQLSYWQEKLRGAPAISSFPADYSRNNEPAAAGITRFKIDSETTATLKQISRQHQATLFMTVLTAWYLLLHRYTGNNDLVIGTPIANRDRSEFENLIGLFANTLALRANLADNPRFTELLVQVRENTLEVYAQQDLPFEQLVDQLELQRSLSYTPLFQIFLAWETQSNQKLAIDNLTWESLPRETAAVAKFDMTIFLTETPEGIHGAIEYSTALYKPETVDRLTKHFHNLLNSIATNPTQTISEIAYLDDAEIKQLLEEFHQPNLDFPQGVCLHQLFEQQAALTPNAIALVVLQQQLTYDELNQQADKLAAYLQSLGVQPESKVGVMCDRNSNLIIALLAILKAGGCYIPLDPNYPQQRLDYILEDTQLNILLTETKYTENLNSSNLTLINLDTPLPLRTSAPLHPRTPTPANLAYIIYTSGSTGKPKGVAIAHQSAVTLSYWAKKTFDLEQLSGVLASTSICFDLSVFEIFVTLASGGAVILAENALELPSLESPIPITLINTVPSAARELLRIKGIPETVNTVNLAGEALPKDLVDKLYQQKHIQQVYNLYGPSEDTTYSTFTLTQAEADQSPTIGKAIANTRTYILDQYLQPLPVGIPGELYLAGAGLARGYYNRGNLTAEKFIPSPFNISSSARLYKTGDLARYLPNGEIEYLGRIDNQIKLRGFRIELGEIETVLASHSDVETAVVINRKNRLIAYVILNKEVEILAQELRQFVAVRLPEYMLPAGFVILEKFPLTSNGKIDRKSLPDPEFTREKLATDLTTATTEAEAKLVKIWQELLGIKKVGIKDNFFALGGDSILAIQVIAKASQVGIRLTPKNLFQHQTIAELAAVAPENQQMEAEQGTVTGIVPLTPIQHWFFAQELLDPHHWNQSLWLEAKQPLKADILEQAIALLLNHHDALRLSFQPTETGWQQVNQGVVLASPLVIIDLANYDEAEQQIEKLKVVNQLQANFNLDTASLVKIAWFKLGDNQTDKLLIIVHHLIIDGVSWRIIIEDLQTIYQQLAAEEEILVAPKTTSWKQWSEKLAEIDLTSELNYWVQQKELCSAVSSNVAPLAEAKIITIKLSSTETKKLLQEVPAAYQTQINDILLTALIQTWQEIYQDNNILIELEGHGREDIIEQVDISRTVGWFTSIYPLVLNLSDTEIAANIKSIKEQIRATPHNGISYGILRYLNQEEALQNFPQAPIRFNYLGQIDRLFTQEYLFYPVSESAGEMRSLRDKRSCPIEIDSIIRDGELRLKWIYDDSEYGDREMEKITQTYLIKLQSLIEHCLAKETGGYTPSDFAQMDFSQDELDDLLDDL
ncbi:MAG: amino acid adenylation domain-containing protein [Cyanobacteria bacterium J06621_8]